LVKAWSDAVIGQLKQKFETYAENYRAQAEQALGGRELTPEELKGIEESLTEIRGDGSGGSNPRVAASVHGIRNRQKEVK
jgi:hypothetical protein